MAVRDVCLLALLCLGNPANAYTPHFQEYRKVGTIDSSAVDEASGLAASRAHRNVLYTHNDSGGHNLIYAIDATSGHLLSTITICGARSHDWEDIACGPCPELNGHCIYIADTGGNYHGEANVLYKVEEPDTLHHTQTISVGHSDMLHFRYIPSENYAEGLNGNPQTLPYHRERQGESVCWDSHGNGYYTVSEGSHPPLYYYERID